MDEHGLVIGTGVNEWKQGRDWGDETDVVQGLVCWGESWDVILRGTGRKLKL